MGSRKKRQQDLSQNRSRETVALEHQRAQELHDEIKGRKADITGQFNEEDMSTAKGGYKDILSGNTSGTRAYEDIIAGNTPGMGAYNRILGDTDYSGAGREGYQEFADTGGFSQADREAFLRRASGVVPAMYARQKDELGRRLAVQGGRMPGFTSSQARLTRQGAQQAAESQLDANVLLSSLVREGRLAGLGGLERTRQASGQEQLAAAGGMTQGQLAAAGGLTSGQLAAAGGLGGLATAEAAGRRDELHHLDKIELQNRLQAAGVSMEDARVLSNMAATNPTLFDRIMQGIGVVGGAAAGVGSAYGSFTGGG